MNDFKTVRMGDTGAFVVAIQCMLYDIYKDSIYVHIDGDFGAETEAAVIALQTSNGITVDGIVGLETWPVLISNWWRS